MPALQPAAAFEAYPPHARALATATAPLLVRLPPIFQAILLREIILFDWKFSIERAQLQTELHLLSTLPSGDLSARMAAFRAIRLSPELSAANYAANPSNFIEQLTAWLWSSGQMTAFRAAAEAYGAFLARANPTPRPPRRRLGIVVIGQGVDRAEIPLFRKLRPQGVHLTAVQPGDALPIILAHVEARAKQPGPGRDQDHAHWYIDGGPSIPSSPGLTAVSYESLRPARTMLLARIQQAIDSGSMGPEALRSLIAQIQPEQVGLRPGSVLDHFALSLLTEGSGTQIFATTFVQWAARECLRRAEPQTLLLRFAPRQGMQPMNVMLDAAAAPAAPDPHGSLVDADMAAYYTWIDMNRLSGADEMSFLVWFEGHAQALAIAPGLTPGTTSAAPTNMQQILSMLA